MLDLHNGSILNTPRTSRLIRLNLRYKIFSRLNGHNSHFVFRWVRNNISAERNLFYNRSQTCLRWHLSRLFSKSSRRDELSSHFVRRNHRHDSATISYSQLRSHRCLHLCKEKKVIQSNNHRQNKA